MKSRETLACIVALAMLAYSLAGAAAVRRSLAELQDEALAAEAELSALIEEKNELLRQLDCAGSDEEMQRLAREKLGLVLPGERIYCFVTDREE